MPACHAEGVLPVTLIPALMLTPQPLLDGAWYMPTDSSPLVSPCDWPTVLLKVCSPPVYRRACRVQSLCSGGA